jgi:hypothetical protein
MKVFSLYKLGSNEPEHTRVTRVKKKKKKTHTDTTQDREEKVATCRTVVHAQCQPGFYLAI